ncbi:TAP-like protein [Nonomuraea maritima]|uniref:TAP-like protein n=1 Tax=Nonomuraea maritima TaxID=683260 RepID=A0A1G9HHC1_9ACTN|nr:alpha/beta hydrolase [Nonomuraea maritima]SDL12285.1 TAP-like protein [Nonomuraea maritima]
MSRGPSAVVQGRSGVLWRDCGDGLQCGTLSVPVDWGRPGGIRTEVNLARMPARDPYRSLGALVVNTGAASTVQDVRARPDTVEELTRWFDVVLMEPRGVGERGGGGAVRCSVPPPDPRLLQLTSRRASWRSYARKNAAYGRSCRIAAGPAYGGLTVRQAAYDLDALRAALGEQRLRYFGSGDGGVYGQAYLERFPRRVERMYLEGVPDVGEASPERRMADRAHAAERRLAYFRDWCRDRLGCPLDDDAFRVLDDLYERAPLPAGPGRRLDARGVAAAVYAGLDPQRWPELARALSQAEQGDAGALSALTAVPVRPAALPTQEAPPPLWPGATGPDEAGSSATRLGAVGPEPVPGVGGVVTRAARCGEFAAAVPDYRVFLEMEKRLRAVAPRVGWLAGREEVARCLGLPGPGAIRPFAVSRLPKGASVLVGIGRLDSVSPAGGSQRVAASIPGATVLRHGDGHDAYLLQGAAKLRAACLRTHVHDFLVNGVRPKPRTFCPGELAEVAEP